MKPSIHPQDESRRATIEQFVVTYEYTDSQEKFGAKFGDIFKQTFRHYDLGAFAATIPPGWIIRSIDPHYVPDA